MVLPLILGAVAIGTALVGIGAGAEGLSDIEKAKKIAAKAKGKYELEANSLNEEWQYTQSLAEQYGQRQIEIKEDTISRFANLLNDRNFDILEGLEGLSIEQIREYKMTAMEAKKLALDLTKALSMAKATSTGAIGIATLFGTASTGTAIGSLSGAAAWNATLAWLGGGSLAAGGGGMALGTLVLGGITIGPALAIVGFVVAGKGEKALTEARDYKAQVNVEIKQLRAAKALMGQIQNRIAELQSILEHLNFQAINLLNQLENKSSSKINDASSLSQLSLLMQSLLQILKTPILDKEGNINPVTDGIIVKYRQLENS